MIHIKADSITHFAGAEVSNLLHLPPLLPFGSETLDFTQALSQALLGSNQAKAHPELVALGFWLRNANIKQLQVGLSTDVHKALGTVLHITPNNVDSMFIYSWICSLLMGNNNIVRLSAELSPVKSLLLDMLNELFQQDAFSQVAQRNSFVYYPGDAEVARQLSLAVQGRIIWGGDNTVNAIRQLPCQPRCRDISFADRYSACVINGDALTADSVDEVAEKLWRDSFPHGQQACSSPRILFWLGSDACQQALFEAIKKQVADAPLWQRTNHLVIEQLIKAQGSGQTLYSDGLTVIAVESINMQMLDWHCGDGLFYLYQTDDLAGLTSVCDSKLQTLSYWGLDKPELVKFIQHPSITGIDRIVPVGQALDFSPRWDGYELLGQLSRQVVVG